MSEPALLSSSVVEIIVSAIVGLIVMALIWSVKSIVRHNEELAVLRAEHQQHVTTIMAMLSEMKRELASMNKWCRMVTMNNHQAIRGEDDE